MIYIQEFKDHCEAMQWDYIDMYKTIKGIKVYIVRNKLTNSVRTGFQTFGFIAIPANFQLINYPEIKFYYSVPTGSNLQRMGIIIDDINSIGKYFIKYGCIEFYKVLNSLDDGDFYESKQIGDTICEDELQEPLLSIFEDKYKELPHDFEDEKRLEKDVELTILTIFENNRDGQTISPNRLMHECFAPKKIFQTTYDRIKSSSYVNGSNTITHEGKNYLSNLIKRSVGYRIAIWSDYFDDTSFKPYTDRINENINNDPALVIGSAKELVEAVSKQILENNGTTEFPQQFPKIVKQALITLQLIPRDNDVEDEEKRIMRKLLSAFNNIIDALSEMRNVFGTGHGKLDTPAIIDNKYGRLAAGAAITLAMFMLENSEKTNLK